MMEEMRSPLLVVIFISCHPERSEGPMYSGATSKCASLSPSAPLRVKMTGHIRGAKIRGTVMNSSLPRVRVAEITFQGEVFAEAVQLEALHALCPPVQRFPGDEGNRPLAKNLWCVVEKHFDNLARRQRRPVHQRSAFDQQAGDLQFSQATDNRREIGRSLHVCRKYLLHANPLRFQRPPGLFLGAGAQHQNIVLSGL